MKGTHLHSILAVLLLTVCTLSAHSQELDVPQDLVSEDITVFPSATELIRYRYREPEIYMGDTLWTYLLPELPVYKPLHFKNAKEAHNYNRLVANVKKVLPIAKLARMMLEETFQTLETLPNKEAKDAHIKQVEHDIREQYTPMMKKLTYSQGKLLIKLIDRECSQEAYDLIKAFIGPARAAFWQVFAWTFGASLKKGYDPEGDDRLIERVVRQVEAGVI